MLFLTRRIGESIKIGDGIEVTVIEVRGRHVKLGFTYPPEVKILRREVYDRIQDENKSAATQAVELSQILKQTSGNKK